jgi:hypothetical protein
MCIRRATDRHQDNGGAVETLSFYAAVHKIEAAGYVNVKVRAIEYIATCGSPGCACTF